MAIDKFTRETVIGSTELVTALQNKAPDCTACGKRMFVHATDEIQSGRAVYWCLNTRQHPAKAQQLTLTDEALEKVLAEDNHGNEQTSNRPNSPASAEAHGTDNASVAAASGTNA